MCPPLYQLYLISIARKVNHPPKANYTQLQAEIGKPCCATFGLCQATGFMLVHFNYLTLLGARFILTLHVSHGKFSMEKAYRGIKAGVVTSVLLSGIGFSLDLAARSLSSIIETNEIRFCLAGSSQEFYRANASAFVTYLNQESKRNIQAKFISFERWNDQFVDNDGVVIRDGEYTPAPLASGKCDLYPNDLVRLGWRESKLAYVDLFLSRNTIISHKSRIAGFRQLGDLAGKTAAVMEGTSYHSWLEEQNRGLFKSNPVQIILLSQKKAIEAVTSNKYDFAITGADGAFWAIKNFAPDAAVAFSFGESRTVMGWCFRKQDTELQEAVRLFFNEQTSWPDSKLNANWKKYIGISLSEFELFVASSL